MAEKMIRVGSIRIPKLGTVDLYRKKGLAYQAFEVGKVRK